MLTIAFIFITEGCDPASDCSLIRSKNITVHVVGVSTYSQAVEEAKKLKAQGCMAIELCPAFGHKGVAYVREAVGDEIPVGVVRFDVVPAFGGKSGDVFFDDMEEKTVNMEEEAAIQKIVSRIMKEIK
mgnify:CR=1 FL=1